MITGMIRAALAVLLLAPAAPAAAEARLERLRLGVKDAPAAADWLEKVLGWKASYRDARRALFDAGAARLELDAADADAPATLVLSGDDADADYRRLLGRGAVSLEEPRDRDSGRREAYLRGPGALTVQIDGPLAAPPDFTFTETRAGSGAAPRPTDTVKVRYSGRLKDGRVFDGAHRSGRPALVPLSSAIPCWVQALGRMRPGGKAVFACPPSTAYGKAGRPPLVPPDATLLFEVELVDVLR